MELKDIWGRTGMNWIWIDLVTVPRRGGAGGSQETAGSLWGDLGLDITAA